METELPTLIQKRAPERKKLSLQKIKKRARPPLSSEAKKMAHWVEQLKQMPDIRTDKIERALQSDALKEPSAAYSLIAQKLSQGLL